MKEKKITDILDFKFTQLMPEISNLLSERLETGSFEERVDDVLYNGLRMLACLRCVAHRNAQKPHIYKK